MVADWKRVEIKVGSLVKHRHPPCPKGQGFRFAGTPEAAGFHNFQGVSRVRDIMSGSTVLVEPTNRQHIAAHMPELLEVVE